MRQDNYNFEKGKHGDIDWVAQKKSRIYLTAQKRTKCFWGLNFCDSRNKAELENTLLCLLQN